MNEYQEKLQELIRRHENRPRMGQPNHYKERAEITKQLREFCKLEWKATDLTPMQLAQLADMFIDYKPSSYIVMLARLARGGHFNYNRQ